MIVLNGKDDYDSIRYALGLEKDQARLLTDQVLEAFPHLPMAEREAQTRYTPPNTSTDVFQTLLARPILDPSLNALKAGVCLLTCAFLCPRLEVTIPIKSSLDNIGEIERNKIDWKERKLEYISQANWFFSLIDLALAPHRFPTVLAHACGRLYPNDPAYWGNISNVSGYIYMNSGASGGGTLFGWPYAVTGTAGVV